MPRRLFVYQVGPPISLMNEYSCDIAKIVKTPQLKSQRVTIIIVYHSLSLTRYSMPLHEVKTSYPSVS